MILCFIARLYRREEAASFPLSKKYQLILFLWCSSWLSAPSHIHIKWFQGHLNLLHHCRMAIVLQRLHFVHWWNFICFNHKLCFAMLCRNVWPTFFTWFSDSSSDFVTGGPVWDTCAVLHNLDTCTFCSKMLLFFYLNVFLYITGEGGLLW